MVVVNLILADRIFVKFVLYLRSKLISPEENQAYAITHKNNLF